MKRPATSTALAGTLTLPLLTSGADATAFFPRTGVVDAVDSSILSRLFSHLFRRGLRRQLPTEVKDQQQSLLLQLPDEILGIIVLHLPLCSRLALRPTCRRLYNLASAAGIFKEMIPSDKLEFLGAYEHDAHVFAFDQVQRATCSFHLKWQKVTSFLESELDRSHHDRQCLLVSRVWVFPRLSLSALDLTEMLQQRAPLYPAAFNDRKRDRINGRTTSLQRATLGHIPPDFHADLVVEKISFQRWQLKLKTWVALPEDEQHAMQKLQQMNIPLCNHSTVCELFHDSHELQVLPAATAPRVCPYPGCRTSCTIQSGPTHLLTTFSPQSHVLYIERLIQQSKSHKWLIDANVWANYAFPNRKFVEMELQWKKHIRWNLE